MRDPEKRAKKTLAKELRSSSATSPEGEVSKIAALSPEEEAVREQYEKEVQEALDKNKVQPTPDHHD